MYHSHPDIVRHHHETLTFIASTLALIALRLGVNPEQQPQPLSSGVLDDALAMRLIDVQSLSEITKKTHGKAT